MIEKIMILINDLDEDNPKEYHISIELFGNGSGNIRQLGKNLIPFSDLETCHSLLHDLRNNIKL